MATGDSFAVEIVQCLSRGAWSAKCSLLTRMDLLRVSAEHTDCSEPTCCALYVTLRHVTLPSPFCKGDMGSLKCSDHPLSCRMERRWHLSLLPPTAKPLCSALHQSPAGCHRCWLWSVPRCGDRLICSVTLCHQRGPSFSLCGPTCVHTAVSSLPA